MKELQMNWSKLDVDLKDKVLDIMVDGILAKDSSFKQIASSRIIKTNIFFNQLNLKKLGFDYDIRSTIYKDIQSLTLSKMNDFFNKEVKPKRYNTAIIGKKESLDFEALKKLGEIEEISLEKIFNY